MKKTLASLLCVLFAATAGAQDTAPTPAAAKMKLETVATGLTAPIFVISDPSKANKLFIVEQIGRIRIVNKNGLRSEPFLDIEDRVLFGGERGLFSMAFPDDWEKRRFFFVNYYNNDNETIVSRFRVQKRNRNQVRIRSEKVVLRVDQPFTNHNGGQLQFGPDGYLYIGMGDGGSGGDPLNAGQDLTRLLGKILRIDVSKIPFLVPPDNPFVGRDGRDAIWALGVRNPWRFSFDRETGDMYIADVGQNALEEVNFQPADSPGGENYGWRVFEGSLPFSNNTELSTPEAVAPIHEYGRSTGRSITGGYAYRGKAFPELNGHYFFADFATRRIWSFQHVNGEVTKLTEWTSQLRTPEGSSVAVSSFGEDNDGELYLCDLIGGGVYKIVPAGE